MMNTARLCRALRPRLTTLGRTRPTQTKRCFSSSYRTNNGHGYPHGSSDGGANHTALLSPFVTELDRIAPAFDVHGSQVQVLLTPADFYETLKRKIAAAKKHIFFSTLYIGKTESELIETIRDALRGNPSLRVSILTDALRGTREAPRACTASLLVPLVAEFGAERVDVRMYHTPNLTGLRKRFVPARLNEGWGLQHMKLYGVDDEIILSGANLSQDYFTNRQDRYHLFSDASVTEYFRKLHQTVASLSYLVLPPPSTSAHDAPGLENNIAPKGTNDFRLVWPSTNSSVSPLQDAKAYIQQATKLIQPQIRPTTSPTPNSFFSTNQSSSSPTLQPDTRVYMLTQFTQLLSPDTSTELPAIHQVLKTLAHPQYRASSWTFTAGYFNPDASLANLFLSTASQRGKLITASPQANGFYKSPGISGMLPDAYTLLLRRFLRRIDRQQASSSLREGERRITAHEWKRGCIGEPGGWTYHAKGLWITLPDPTDAVTTSSSTTTTGPCISVIGSSNYTRRSYTLDLEAGALVVTRNPQLRRQWAEEEERLQTYAQGPPVTQEELARNDRRVGLHVQAAMWLVQVLGGAL